MINLPVMEYYLLHAEVKLQTSQCFLLKEYTLFALFEFVNLKSSFKASSFQKFFIYISYILNQNVSNYFHFDLLKSNCLYLM